MNFVFLMDPVSALKIETDTSYMFMLSAAKRGHKIFYLENGGIALKDNKVCFHLKEVVPQEDIKNPFIEKQSLELTHNEVDIVFIRTDPPFDEQYLLNTWLLDRLPDTIPAINKASGIRTANEKIWAAQFTSLIPRTLISGQKQDLLEFLNAEKKIIVKPTDGFGGSSIFIVTRDDPNWLAILETLFYINRSFLSCRRCQ